MRNQKKIKKKLKKKKKEKLARESLAK